MRKLISFFTLLAAFSVKAQQLPQYSMVVLNKSLYNPAYIGSTHGMSLGLGGRWQTVGFGGEPRSGYLTFEKSLNIREKERVNPGIRISSPIPESETLNKNKFSHGIGGQMVMDKTGAFGSFQLAGLYGAHYQVNKSLKISAGARLSWTNNNFDAAKAVVLNPNDPAAIYQGGDTEYDEFIAGKWNANYMHFGAGINVQYQNFFMGVSANQLSKGAIRFGSSNVNFDPKLHAFLITGYNFDISSEFKLQTTVIVKSMQPAPASFEFNAMASIGESLFAGLNYHHKASAGFFVGFNLNEKFRVAYALDVPTTRLNKFSWGGHELSLNYKF